MKYMLMMNTAAGGDYQIMSWPKKDIEAHIAFMIGFSQKLAASGELAGAEGLAPPSQAKLVRAGKNGKTRHGRPSFLNRRSFSPATGSCRSILLRVRMR